MRMERRTTLYNGCKACEVIIADTLLQRLRGLLFRPNWKGGMLIPTKSVHTCFMKQSIDVFFLDRQGRVVHTILDLRPWRITPIVGKAKMVVEVPSGALGDRMIRNRIELDQLPKGGRLHV